uniref:ATP synthase F(1) complex subunit delta, mitochondrial n=1 Tax=Pavo cristatus TaxID=9049 RepID=A0A8C9FW85_PAVCR
MLRPGPRPWPSPSLLPHRYAPSAIGGRRAGQSRAAPLSRRDRTEAPPRPWLSPALRFPRAVPVVPSDPNPSVTPRAPPTHPCCESTTFHPPPPPFHDPVLCSHRPAAADAFPSPSQVFYNGANVKQVDVPTLTGSFGILASHVPTLQVLKPGVVTVYGEDGTATKYFVSSGSVTVNADSTVQVLAEEAVTMDMLDLATAKSNLEKAVSEVAAASDEAAKAEAQIKVEANEALVKALE